MSEETAVYACAGCGAREEYDDLCGDDEGYCTACYAQDIANRIMNEVPKKFQSDMVDQIGWEIRA